MRYLLAILTLLLVTTQASAQAGYYLSRGDFARGTSAWSIYSRLCTDNFDTDANGNGPPAGSVDLTDPTNYDTFAEAYDLQANIGAPTQVSGSPDGLCDDWPETLKGNFTAAGDETLWIGPIVPPAAGFIMHQSQMGDGTAQQFHLYVDVPWRDPVVIMSTASNDLASDYFTFSPFIPAAGGWYDGSDAMPFPSEPLYFVIQLTGAATWVFELMFVPLNADRFGQ